jgi:hypothetical protein
MFLVFAGALVISAFTIRRGIDPFDEGLTLQAARRVASGQLPYSEFLWPYGPAQPYLLAGTFKLFGTSLLWWRVLRVLVDAAVSVTVFALVGRSAPRWVAVVASLTTACAMAQPTGANPFAPALLFALLALLAAERNPASAGVLCAIAAAFRLDFGVFAIVASLVAIGVAHESRAAALRAGACAAVAFAGLATLVYLPFVVADGPADAWRDLIGRSLHQGRAWHLPFPYGYDGRLRLWPPGSLAHDAKDVLEFYVPLLLLAGVALVALALALRRTRPRPEVAGLGLLALCFVAYLLSRTDEFHVTPLLVVLAALLPLASDRRAGAAMAVVLALLLAYGASNRLSALFGPPALSAIHVPVADGVEAPPADARAIERMVAAVQRRVPPGAPIYTITRRSDLVRINDPLIYVLTERDNPTRADFGLQTGAPAQREIVAALERARPRVIVRWTDPGSVEREPNRRGRPTGVRILDDWVAGHYRLAARHGHYDVLVPRAA